MGLRLRAKLAEADDEMQIYKHWVVKRNMSRAMPQNDEVFQMPFHMREEVLCQLLM